jgi:predicted CoA-binding protein
MRKTVAVVGASADRGKFGNKAVRAFDAQGWRVAPIHPTADAIEGHRAYPTVVDVPGAIDMATVYVPPHVGLTLLAGFARKGIPEIWVNPGAESAALLAEAERLGLHVIAACSIIGIGESPGRY